VIAVGVVLGSMILTPFWFRLDSVDSLFLGFRSDSVLMDLDILSYVPFGLRMFPVTLLYVHLFTLHYVSRACYDFTISLFSDSAVTLNPYLIVSNKRTQILASYLVPSLPNTSIYISSTCT